MWKCLGTQEQISRIASATGTRRASRLLVPLVLLRVHVLAVLALVETTVAMNCVETTVGNRPHKASYLVTSKPTRSRVCGPGPKCAYKIMQNRIRSKVIKDDPLWLWLRGVACAAQGQNALIRSLKTESLFIWMVKFVHLDDQCVNSGRQSPQGCLDLCDGRILHLLLSLLLLARLLLVLLL